MSFKERARQRLATSFAERAKQRLADAEPPITDEAQLSSLEGIDALQEVNPPAPLPKPEPKPTPQSWYDPLLQTGKDSLRGLNSGLYLGGSDEVAAAGRAATGNAEFGKALDEERTENAAAEQRSPWAYNLSKTAGYVPGMLVGGAARGAVAGAKGLQQLAPAARNLSALVQGTVGGALSSDSDDLTQTLKDANKGAALSVGLSLLGRGAKPEAPTSFKDSGLPIARVPGKPPPLPPRQQTLAGFEIPKAPPPPVAAAAPVVAEAAVKKFSDTPLGKATVGTLTHGITGTLGGVIGGHHGQGVAGTIAGMYAGHQLQPLVAQGVDRAAPIVAGVARSAGSAASATGQLGSLMGPMAASGNSRGNLLPQAALDTLQHEPLKLGKYQAQFAQAAASEVPSSVGSLLARLTQSDEEFRRTVLPALQQATMEGR